MPRRIIAAIRGLASRFKGTASPAVKTGKGAEPVVVEPQAKAQLKKMEAPEASARQKAQGYFAGGLKSKSFLEFCAARRLNPKNTLAAWVQSARHQRFFTDAYEAALMSEKFPREQFPEDSPQLFEAAGRMAVRDIVAAIVEAEKKSDCKKSPFIWK